jgi:hypothetical protein
MYTSLAHEFRISLKLMIEMVVKGMWCHTSVELPSAPELAVRVGQALELLILERFRHAGVHPEPLLDLDATRARTSVSDLPIWNMELIAHL